MSDSFKGLKSVRKMVKHASKKSGIPMSVRTVSCELTSFREGQFPIERGPWERSLIRLFAAYAPDRDNGWREYGVDFENDTFHVHVDYCDADCSCAYGVEEKVWLAQHKHSADCFVSVCGRFVAEIEKQYPVPHYEFLDTMDDYDIAHMVEFWHGGPGPTDEQKAAHEEKQATREAERVAYFKVREVHKKLTVEAVAAEAERRSLKLEYDPEWCWQYCCTCGHSAEHEAWQTLHDHVKPCEIWWMGQPNFLHKLTGYAVHWYKYPCRDGYGNQPKTLRQFQAIIRECIGSLEQAPRRAH